MKRIGVTGAFASKARANPLFDVGRVEIRELDVLDPAALARELSGLDALAHFAGRVDYRRSSRQSVWESCAIGAKRVFDAALEAGLSRLLYVSSVCVLGSSPSGRFADEREVPYGDPRWPISFASPERARLPSSRRRPWSRPGPFFWSWLRS